MWQMGTWLSDQYIRMGIGILNGSSPANQGENNCQCADTADKHGHDQYSLRGSSEGSGYSHT